jgi:catechol 2,3-dioxygenase-like lactoylglutathione lyase family enzyme
VVAGPDPASARRQPGVLTLGVVVLGVTDAERAARFWSEALGYGWPGSAIALQRSETPPQDRPRMHLDLHVPDAAEQAAEVERLVALGARRVDWDAYPDDPDFVVLADPDGNRFCVVDLGHEDG